MQHLFSYMDETYWVVEGAIWRPPRDFPLTLVDEAGVVIGSGTITTLTLTLYDPKTGAIVNSVDGTDIKNARNCTLNPQGVFVLTLLPADTVLLDSSKPYEKRRALVQWTWSAGSKADALQLDFVIRNFAKRGL